MKFYTKQKYTDEYTPCLMGNLIVDEADGKLRLQIVTENGCSSCCVEFGELANLMQEIQDCGKVMAEKALDEVLSKIQKRANSGIFNTELDSEI